MTPTEQDKELRQKMQDIFNDCTSGWLITIKDFNGYERELGDMESEIIGDILDLITADRKRVALEGKIEELKAFKDRMWSEVTVTSSDANYPNAMHFRLNDRIEKLTQELEGNK